MSSENYVRIIMVENLRFLGEGSSALGKSEAKARPKGVVDAQTVDIPLPSKLLSKGTHSDRGSRALVVPGERERISAKSSMPGGEKSLTNWLDVRTANRHR